MRAVRASRDMQHRALVPERELGAVLITGLKHTTVHQRRAHKRDRVGRHDGGVIEPLMAHADLACEQSAGDLEPWRVEPSQR